MVSDGSWDSVSEEAGEGTADVSRKSKSRRKRFNSEVLANDRKKMQSIPQIKASEYVTSEYQIACFSLCILQLLERVSRVAPRRIC